MFVLCTIITHIILSTIIIITTLVVIAYVCLMQTNQHHLRHYHHHHQYCHIQCNHHHHHNNHHHHHHHHYRNPCRHCVCLSAANNWCFLNDQCPSTRGLLIALISLLSSFYARIGVVHIWIYMDISTQFNFDRPSLSSSMLTVIIVKIINQIERFHTYAEEHAISEQVVYLKKCNFFNFADRVSG